MKATQLKALRLSFGWKQSDLARRLAINRITVRRYETGESPIPKNMEIAIKAIFDFQNQQPLLNVAKEGMSDEEITQSQEVLRALLDIHKVLKGLATEMAEMKAEMKEMSLDMEAVKLLMELDDM